MVTIKKRAVGKQTYYYLEHSLRESNKIQKKERYLGKELPKNLDTIKREFVSEIYKEKWFNLFDKIKTNFSKEQKTMPKYSKEKETATFAVKFTYNTNRIEGSKLTLRETADLLERGVTPKTKSLDDIKEAEAHKKLFYEIMSYKKDLSLQAILAWHKKLFESTKYEIAGKIRGHQVAISGSRFVPPFPAEIYSLLREFFKFYSKNIKRVHPVELAALVHLKFVTIHPFADGNGRISRLLMNFVLHKYGFPLLDIPYENRTGYYNSLERSQVKNNESIFMQWFFKRYLKEYEKYLRG